MQAIDTIAKALHNLDVHEHTLTIEQKQQLDQAGFLEIHNVLTPAQCQQMVTRLDEIATNEGQQAGKDFHTEAGTTRLGSLINKDALFDICALHPLVLASINHILKGEFGLSSITSRTAHPGEGLQPLHCDSSLEIRAANALWLLDDFTPHNGPTRLVPGSHLSGKYPEDAGDPTQPYPREIHVIAPVGTLLIINAFTWHGGTRNNTTRPRHLISAFFTQRGKYQSISMRRLSPSTQARMSEAALYILDPS